MDEEEVEEEDVEEGRKAPTSFVTVINVPAPKGECEESDAAPSPAIQRCGTYTKPRPAKKEPGHGAGSLGRRPVPKLPPARPLYRRQESGESLASISSPLSPSSPVEGGCGEAPALSSSPSPPTTTTSSGRARATPEPPVRAPRAKEQVVEAPSPSLSSSEEISCDLTSSRGRPDGGEGEEEGPPVPMDRSSKVRYTYKFYKSSPQFPPRPFLLYAVPGWTHCQKSPRTEADNN